MTSTKEARLVEVTSCPVIYCDGLGKVVVEGHNARLTYFEYRTFGNERVKMPVLEIVRPVASCKGNEMMDHMMKAVGAGATSAELN